MVTTVPSRAVSITLAFNGDISKTGKWSLISISLMVTFADDIAFDATSCAITCTAAELAALSTTHQIQRLSTTSFHVSTTIHHWIYHCSDTHCHDGICEMDRYVIRRVSTQAGTFTSPTRAVAKYCNRYVCVCLCVRPRGYLQNTIFVHAAYGRGSVLLQQGDEIPRPRGMGNFGDFLPHWQCIVQHIIWDPYKNDWTD